LFSQIYHKKRKTKYDLSQILILFRVLLNCVDPLYSYLSKAKGVNVRWALGCKAGTEQSELTQVNPSRFYIGIATPKIGIIFSPNFEVQLNRPDYS
jgi:hypothetical protein